MKNHKIISRWLPAIVAIVIFLALSMIYFAPQYEGKTLTMHDITQLQGMGKDIQDHTQKFGEDPQWAGRMFGGMPAYLINFKFDSSILKRARNAFEFIGFPASLIFVAMLCFFFMLLLYGVDPWIGIIPSLAYGLSTYFFIIIGAGHATKMVALAYAPLMLGAVFYTYRRNMWLGAALTAFAGSLEIAAGHPQITYYFALVVLAFFINEFVRSYKKQILPRFAKASALLALAAALAVGTNFGPLWYVQQHSKETIRGGSELKTQADDQTKVSAKRGSGLDIGYATQWSYGRTESFNMLIPNLMGGESSGGFSSDGEVAASLGKYNARAMATKLPGYWGDQPITAGPTYIGAVIIFLCVMGLFVLKGRKKWWIVAVSGVAILLSWGSNMMWFTELFFNYLPGYNKFRTVAMILVIVEWSVPFVAALLLNKLWKQEIAREQLIKALKYSLYIVGGVSLVFALLGSSLFNFAGPSDAQMGLPDDVLAAMRTERAQMLSSDAWRSLVYVLLTAGVVVLFGLGKIKKWMLVAGLSVLVCADMLTVDARYLPQSRFDDPVVSEIKPTKADLQIMADSSKGYRVANFAVSTFNDATTSYFHRSIGGYHGAKLQRYQDLIDRHLSKMNWGVYNMLNTKYLIIPDQKTGEPVVQFNPEANGAAWFVNRVEFVDSADAEIDALNSIDTKITAVVDKKFEKTIEKQGLTIADLTADSTAKIELVEYRPNLLEYEYTCDNEALAVFSEIYYDQGWKAYVDGEPAEYIRADYVLRAMVLPAGKHVVEFKFRAPHYATLSAITLASCLIIIIWLITALIFSLKKHNGTREQ